MKYDYIIPWQFQTITAVLKGDYAIFTLPRVPETNLAWKTSRQRHVIIKKFGKPCSRKYLFSKYRLLPGKKNLL